MAEFDPHEGEAQTIVSLAEAAMHMYRAAIDSLPFPEDKKFQKRADVVLTEAGAEIIEQGGKDPKSAARIALHRLLKSGRDPFASQISLQIPYGHAAHFSRYGNYDSLPVLTD